jgi:uncharacterized membrane protein
VKHIKTEEKVDNDYIPGPQTHFPIFGFYKINFIIYLILVSWVIIIFITPAFIPSGSILFDDKGIVGIDEHFAEIETIEDPFIEVVYHSGDQMCHQKGARSFIVFDNQMSYCARCFGIFLGLALGAAIATFVWIDLKWWLLVLGIIPIGLDGGLQLITSYESNNVLRIFTGSLLGVVTMLAVGLVVIELSEFAKLRMNYMKFHKKKAPNGRK